MPWPSSAVNSGPRRLSQAHGITETCRNSQPTCSAASCSSPADRPDVQSQAEVQSLSKGKHLGRPMSMTTFVATDGAAYELFMGRWTDWLAEPFLAFARIDPETASGAHLLDVGCGTGRLTFAAAARAPQLAKLVGVDLSESFLAYA